MNKLSQITYSITLILGAFLVGLGLWLGDPHISQKSVDPRGELIEHFPWRFHDNKARTFTIHYNPSAFLPNIARIIPDDQLISVHLNDRSIDLSKFSTSELRDYKNGIVVDFSKYSTPGNNELRIVVANNGGGPGGLDIIFIKPAISYIVLFIGLLLTSTFFTKLFNCSPSQKAAIALSLIPILTYLSYTPWYERTNDVDGPTGHYGYIQYVAENKSIPNPNSGWSYYHPPLYYISAAPVYLWSKWAQIESTVALQYYAIVLWLLFLAAACGIARLYLDDRPSTLLAASLAICLWPSGIMHSIRIGNDAAFYAVMAVGFYHICKWWFDQQVWRTWAVAILIIAGLTIKTNGIILPATAGILLCTLFYRDVILNKNYTWFTHAFILATGLILGIVASYAVRAYYYFNGENANWLVGNLDGLNRLLSVDNSYKAYIPMEVTTFLTTPYMSAWDDAAGRNNFWNYLLRSALSAPTPFTSVFKTIIAVIWGPLLLLLIASLFKRQPANKDLTITNAAPLYLGILLFVCSLIVFRYLAPFASSNDFRYILPVLPLVLILATQSKFQRYLLHTFSVSSFLFYVSPP